MQDLSNHTMDATISTSSNADPSTASDVRSWPTSNNSGRCSERHTGSHSKNRDKTTPQKQNPKRLNMLVNINGYKKLARKCPKRITYMHNMKILCQGREDNPVRTYRCFQRTSILISSVCLRRQQLIQLLTFAYAGYSKENRFK